MNSKLKQRMVSVQLAREASAVSLALITAELNELASKLCQTFEVPYGSLVRTALAIREIDNADTLNKEHLQEAAQHLIIDGGTSLYHGS